MRSYFLKRLSAYIDLVSNLVFFVIYFVSFVIQKQAEHALHEEVHSTKFTKRI